MAFCYHCGAKLPDGASVCGQCGTSVSTSSTAYTPPVYVPPAYTPPVSASPIGRDLSRCVLGLIVVALDFILAIVMMYMGYGDGMWGTLLHMMLFGGALAAITFAAMTCQTRVAWIFAAPLCLEYVIATVRVLTEGDFDFDSSSWIVMNNLVIALVPLLIVWIVTSLKKRPQSPLELRAKAVLTAFGVYLAAQLFNTMISSSALSFLNHGRVDYWLISIQGSVSLCKIAGFAAVFFGSCYLQKNRAN